MLHEVHRIFFVLRQPPRSRQRRSLHAQPHKHLPVLIEVLGIRKPIPAHIRPTRILRIRPPIIPFRKIIMQPPRTSLTVRRSHRQWLFRQKPLCRTQYPRPIHLRNQRISIIPSSRPSPRKRHRSRCCCHRRNKPPPRHFRFDHRSCSIRLLLAASIVLRRLPCSQAVL